MPRPAVDAVAEIAGVDLLDTARIVFLDGCRASHADLADALRRRELIHHHRDLAPGTDRTRKRRLGTAREPQPPIRIDEPQAPQQREPRRADRRHLRWSKRLSKKFSNVESRIRHSRIMPAAASRRPPSAG
jgi:hypothetical protein